MPVEELKRHTPPPNFFPCCHHRRSSTSPVLCPVPAHNTDDDGVLGAPHQPGHRGTPGKRGGRSRKGWRSVPTLATDVQLSLPLLNCFCLLNFNFMPHGPMGYIGAGGAAVPPPHADVRLSWPLKCCCLPCCCRSSAAACVCGTDGYGCRRCGGTFATTPSRP